MDRAVPSGAASCARSATALLIGALASCASASGAHGPGGGNGAEAFLGGVPAGHARGIASGTITHVIIIDQENRSFDDMFYGYPGANTATTGRTASGQVVPLSPISLAAPYDILHGSNDFFTSWDLGKMDGFSEEKASGQKTGIPNFQYGYVPASERQPYIDLANQYVLDDNAFTSQLDASFTAHQYIYAATANHAVNFPGGPWGCTPRQSTVGTLTDERTPGGRELACFDHTSLPSELEDAGVSWRWYGTQPGGFEWVGIQADRSLKMTPAWKQHFISPSTQFIDDVAAGNLAGVTWITPGLRDSDHAGSRSTTGPQYVASLVNAVGQSPFWSNSVIFLMWDDWGGWYDHVPPPQLDFDGLGFRVPLLCISPYAAQGVVSHELYETASILKFVELNWGLPTLAAADARANSAGDGCLNANARPRTFSRIKTTSRPADFVEREDPLSDRILRGSEGDGGD
jgi:phospholipase C